MGRATSHCIWCRFEDLVIRVVNVEKLKDITIKKIFENQAVARVTFSVASNI